MAQATDTSTGDQESGIARRATPLSPRKSSSRTRARPVVVNEPDSAGTTTGRRSMRLGEFPAATGAAATLVWTARTPGLLPATGCCGSACTHDSTPPSRNWQPLPFEADDACVDNTNGVAPRAAVGQELQVARMLSRLCAEVGWGLRPAHQCVAWSSRHAYETLSKRHLRAKAIGQGKAPVSTLTVTGVRAQVSNNRSMECSAVVLTRHAGGVRASALAIRAVNRKGTWWVTAVEM